MNDDEIKQLVLILVIGVALLCFFLAVLWFSLRLSLGDPEKLAVIGGKLKRGIYGTFSQRR